MTKFYLNFLKLRKLGRMLHPYIPRLLHPCIHNIDDKVDTLKTPKGGLGPDRIDSVAGHHSLITPPYEIDSLYVLLLYSKVPAGMCSFIHVVLSARSRSAVMALHTVRSCAFSHAFCV